MESGFSQRKRISTVSTINMFYLFKAFANVCNFSFGYCAPRKVCLFAFIHCHCWPTGGGISTNA